MKNKGTLTGQIDNSDLVRYPNGKVQNNDGSNNGTPVNDFTQSDVQEFFYKLLRLAGYTPNGDFDNEVNGYQTVDALTDFVSKNERILLTGEIDSLGNIVKGSGFTSSVLTTGIYQIDHDVLDFNTYTVLITPVNVTPKAVVLNLRSVSSYSFTVSSVDVNDNLVSSGYSFVMVKVG